MEQLGDFLREKRLIHMHELKDLTEQYLGAWTGANRQNDDIMVIGFKVT